MTEQTRDSLKRQVSEELLGLPDVSLGRRFGGEAFFYRKRFFAHFHPTAKSFYLETFVWNKVDNVVKEIPGVVAHPEYRAYGWVRLPIDSERELTSARKLVERTYRYLRTTKRISIPKERFSPELLDKARRATPDVRFTTKDAAKRIQIVMEIPGASDYEWANKMLDQAAEILRKR